MQSKSQKKILHDTPVVHGTRTMTDPDTTCGQQKAVHGTEDESMHSGAGVDLVPQKLLAQLVHLDDRVTHHHDTTQ